MKLIVATDLNGVIGCRNKIPWHVPEDLQYFKNQTSGKTVVMGRKTSESLRPFFACGRLPNRRNIIISSSVDECSNVLRDGVSQTWTCDAQSIYDKTANLDDENTWIIGGAAIYRYFLPVVDSIYLTQVHTEIDREEADAYFTFDKNTWKLYATTPVLVSSSKAPNGKPYQFTHQIYNRK